MNYDLYYSMKYLYELETRYNLANNIMKVMYGYMNPQQLFYYTSRDELIKQILFEYV